jgi:beta-N-acetylhexosaminidase
MPPRLRQLAGQLIVGGFAGTTLPASYRSALARGERAGAILFRRNLTGDAADLLSLNRSIEEAGRAYDGSPALIGVDQEGGRVTRLGPPALRLPPMRAFGRLGDAGLVERAASVLGAQLSSLGFTMDFAPVLDVDTCPTNPIIGDRSFHSDPAVVARLGAAFAGGLQGAGVMACGKHFPGHGDTTLDSHLDLPVVDLPRSRLESVELAPYRGLRASTCAAVMTAHVGYPCLDGARPATLSRAIVTGLLRDALGYDGLAISDDLEMKAVADRMPIQASAVEAVRAGCDVLLICSSEELQEAALDALVLEAESDAAFRAAVEAAAARCLAARRSFPPDPRGGSEPFVGARARAMAAELEQRGVFG